MPSYNENSVPARVIIYILHSGNLNGTERMALATLEGLHEYETKIIFAPPSGKAGSVADAAARLNIKSKTFRSHWQLLKNLLPWFVRYRALDIIDVGVGSSWICHVLGRLFAVRLRQLQVAHGGTDDAHAYGSKAKLNDYPVCIVAVSEFVKQRLIAHNVRPEKIKVVNNFLPHSQLIRYRRGDLDNEPGRYPQLKTSHALRVAIVSRVDKIKKIDILVEAIERHGLSEFEFDIYGEGEELTALSHQAKGFTNIRFHGYVKDVAERLTRSDILLHLCPEEPFGLVILEAFAAGLGVVVPDSGGSASLVDDGQTGLRFTANDADDLCRVLMTVHKLPAEHLKRLADAGYAALQTRFSQTTGIELYRQAFTESRLTLAPASAPFVERRVAATGVSKPPAGIGERRRSTDAGMSQVG